MKSSFYNHAAGLLCLSSLFLMNCTPAPAENGGAGGSSNTGGNASAKGGSGGGSGGSTSSGGLGWRQRQRRLGWQHRQWRQLRRGRQRWRRRRLGWHGRHWFRWRGHARCRRRAGHGTHQPAAAVGKLDKTLFKVVITKYDGDGRSGCGVVASQVNQLNEDTLKGDATKTYDVTFRVRGLVEPRMYNGGMTDPASPFINVGGTPNNGGAENQGQYGIFKVEVADPKMAYYINAFHTGHTDHQVYPMDYKLKVKAKGGSKISVSTVDTNACAIANKANKVVDGVPTDVVMQPFKDQFLYVEAESVAEAP